MATDFAGIMSELRAGKFRPIYFLQGEEPFYIDEIANYIAEHAMPEDLREFNQTVAYASDMELPAMVSEARRYPMMADRVVVVIKEAQVWRNIVPAEDAKGGLLVYAEAPQPSTVLVVCHKHKTLDARKKRTKELLAAIERSGGVVFTSERVKDYKLAEWIMEQATRLGFRCDPRSAALLADHLGNDLSRIINEMEKLRIHLGDGGAITADAIEKHIGISKDFNVFELQTAMAERNIPRANRIVLHFIHHQKEHPVPAVLANLHGYFLKIGLMHHLQRTQRTADAAKVLGVNPYFLKDYQKAAAAFQPRKVQLIMGHLRDADLAFKGVDSPSSDPESILKELIFKIMN